MSPNPHLEAFTEEIRNAKLHVLCSVSASLIEVINSHSQIFLKAGVLKKFALN